MTIYDDVMKWIGLSGDVEEVIKEMTKADKLIVSYLNKIAGFVNSSATELGDIRFEVEKHLGKLGDIGTTLGLMKTKLTSLTNIIDPSVEGSLGEGLSDMKGFLSTIKDKAGNLDAIATDISSAKSSLSGLYTGLISGADSLKVKFDTMIGKMGKLEDLSTIVTKIGDLETSIKNLSFELPEIGDITLETTDLMEELKKHTSGLLTLNNTIKGMNANFEQLTNKLGVLNNINENLINQITLQQYGMDLLRSNIPMAQSFFDLSKKLNELNNLGFKIVNLEVSPLEYFERYSEIMQMTTESISIPEMPEIDISETPPPPPPEISPFIVADIGRDITGDITGDIIGTGDTGDDLITVEYVEGLPEGATVELGDFIELGGEGVGTPPPLPPEPEQPPEPPPLPVDMSSMTKEEQIAWQNYIREMIGF